jgi:hypothetical protein
MNENPSPQPVHLPPCPRCHGTDRIRRKLITVFPDVNSRATPGLPGQSHLVITPPNGRGTFLNGFYCDTCQIGFVSKSILAEVGLSKADIMNLEIHFTDTEGPDSYGYYGPRLGNVSRNA